LHQTIRYAATDRDCPSDWSASIFCTIEAIAAYPLINLDREFEKWLIFFTEMIKNEFVPDEQ